MRVIRLGEERVGMRLFRMWYCFGIGNMGEFAGSGSGGRYGVSTACGKRSFFEVFLSLSRLPLFDQSAIGLSKMSERP